MNNEISAEHAGIEDEHSLLSKVNRLNRLLGGLDERGLILSLAAFAEECLGELIRAFLMSVPATNSLLEGFNAPLGTLSARIKMAYALGLVTPEQFQDLERLRKIRNEFSHSWEHISLETPKIRGQIEALNYNWIDDEYPDTPIKKMKSSLAFLLTEIAVAITQIDKKAMRLRVTGSRLMGGLTGSIDDQITACERRFDQLNSELEGATGEYRRFLLFRWDAWLDKLKLVWINAPGSRRSQIDSLRAFYEEGKPT